MRYGWVHAMLSVSLREWGDSAHLEGSGSMLPPQETITRYNRPGQFSSNLQASILEKVVEKVIMLQFQKALEETDDLDLFQLFFFLDSPVSSKCMHLQQ